MVQALCDLAEGYAKEGLWPQASQAQITVFPEYVGEAESWTDCPRPSHTSEEDEPYSGVTRDKCQWQGS